MRSVKFVLITAALLFSAAYVQAGEEGMPQMPKIGASQTYTVKSKTEGEDLLDNRGFGDKEPMVRMMNLMMVAGSGYEGMDMNAAKKAQGAHDMGQMQMAADSAHNAANSSKNNLYKVKVENGPIKVGANKITFTVVDSKTGRVAKGLKLKAQVHMTTMDMGTDEPRVREISPGKYQIKATFAMKGAWAVKLTSASGEQIFNFDVPSLK